MAEQMQEKPVAKKRPAATGYRRVMVSLSDGEYRQLEEIAKQQMREPNNMLSFMLRGRMAGILADFKE